MKEVVKAVAKDIDDLEENEKETDLADLWATLEFKIDENYEYVPKDKLFCFFSNLLYYGIAFPVLKILTKIIYDLKIEGKDNIENLKGGAISVSNHVLVLDCAMVGLAYSLRKVYYTTQEESFKIPFVRKLIKLLNAVPIPKDISNKKDFMKAIDSLLQEGKIVHFYPEATLVSYYNGVREFRSGAFSFAVRNNVPVVPIVLNFRNPKGIRKYLKKKKDVTLTILEPVKCTDTDINEKEKIEKLKDEVYRKMTNIV